MSEHEDSRAAGMAKMQEVYGFTVNPADLPGRYVDVTVDHLFGTIWTDDTIELRDRRLLTIGVLAAQDKPELLEIQFDNALERGELTVDQVRELVVHLTHYVGWPISTGVSGAAETVIRRRAAATDARSLMSDHRIEVGEAAPGVRVIAFNRPEVRNAFDTTMYQEVTAALRAADGDETVGAVVLTGRGTAFTSGQDLAEMAAIATGTAVEGAGQGFMGLLECLIDLSVPLLAAVNGVAVGLGFTLLPHCNLVLVDAGARLRVPFAELGVPPEAASSVLFPAAMGWQQAARVLLTSDWVSAPELVELGLALKVCDPGTVLDETVALAARIAAHPRGATRASTSLVRAARRDAVVQANRREQAAFGTLLAGAVGSGTLAEFAARPATGS